MKIDFKDSEKLKKPFRISSKKSNNKLHLIGLVI